VATAFFATPKTVGAATGTNFPDGLAAGPGLGLADAPLLLVEPTGALPPTVLAYLQAAGGTVTAGTLFGGPLAVTDQVLAELDGAL
jgi:ell wall binding domain 2 (CWB2)